MKIFKYFCLLCLVGLLALPDVYAGDYTRFNSIEVKRTRDDDAQARDSLRLEDQSGVTSVFRFTKTGEFFQYDTDSSTTQFGIDASGQIMKRAFTSVDLSGTSYYNVTAPGVYWIDDHESTLGTRIASGVSIILYKITSTSDGDIVRLIKIPNLFTGSTKIVVSTAAWASGTTDFIWNATSGATNESSTKVPPEVSEMDAAGDWLEFTAKYGATGSTWYQTGRYVQ